MMDIQDISQYTHKIIKIKLTNKNKVSFYSNTTIKIHLEKEQNEIIRFSTAENSKNGKWLNHQSNGNDYFLLISNIPSSTTYIYAHYLPAHLYNYIEDTQIFSIYDFADLFKDAPTEKFYNQRYPLQIRSYGYEMMLGSENKPYIRSVLNKSINKYKDPNYKQYVIGKTASDKLHMTEQGRFPLSSRYRQSKYNIAPNFDADILPHWDGDEDTYSYNNNPTITSTTYTNDTYTYNNISSLINNNEYTNASDCTKRKDLTPFWELKIHKSALIPPSLEDDGAIYAEDTELMPGQKDIPINVFLNYQYLPTSTEYHQHYFGFEGRNIYKNNTKIASDALSDIVAYSNNIKNGTYNQLTANKNFEVLDGEGLDYINNQFGNQATYRLINHGNPFNDNYIMTTSHENIIKLDLSDNRKVIENCTWEQSKCEDEAYWKMTPLVEDGGDSKVIFNKTLKANTPYVLKYYMYIPAQAYVEDSSKYKNYHAMSEEEEIDADTCFISVHNIVNDNVQVIGQLDKTFRKQDKKLRHQWIYHEIPFFTIEPDVKIVIKGPKHSINDLYTYNLRNGNVNIKSENFTEEEKASSDLELHDCRNDIIYFYDIEIAEMVEYSPTIKYTNTGLYVVEEDKYTRKPLKDVGKQDCISTSTDSLPQWKNTKDIPIPDTDIYVTFAGDFEILYNELTSEIRWTQGFDFNFKPYSETFDVTLAWEQSSNDIKLQYPELLTDLTEAQYQSKKNNETIDVDTREDRTNDLSSDLQQGRWSLYREQFTTFTNGINNEFTLRIEDAYGKGVTKGTVECAIFTAKDENADCADAEKCLGIKEPDEHGEVKYQNLNFRKFHVTDNTHKYWLRIKYYHQCYQTEIIIWKELIFIQEHANMIVYANRCFTNNGLNSKICNSLSNITSNSNCCKYCTSSYYDTNTGKYQSNFILRNTSTVAVNGPKQYTINTVDDLPLRLDVMIRSEPTNEHTDGNIIDEGYCELSINDVILQTTYVDSNGIADFYLDENDLQAGINTVKIEYYMQKNYETTNFAYFVINCNQQTYDTRDVVPITIYSVYADASEQSNQNVYNINNSTDMLLIDITSQDHSNFSITIQKHNDSTNKYEITDVQNIYSSSDTDIIAIENPDNDKINHYKIITDNLAYQDTTTHEWKYKDGEYRRNEKEITVYWGV